MTDHDSLHANNMMVLFGLDFDQVILIKIACRTGVIFCVFQENRGESEASAKRELRARGAALKKIPPVPIPLFKLFRPQTHPK